MKPGLAVLGVSAGARWLQLPSDLRSSLGDRADLVLCVNAMLGRPSPARNHGQDKSYIMSTCL
eukprot:758823-Hanusia_phi.AAC.4